MRHLIIRAAFGVFIVILYLSGRYVTPWVNETFNVDLDIKVLLPLFSLSFYDYWLRIFTNLMIKFKFSKNITEKEILLNVNLSYFGNQPVSITIMEISGVRPVNIEVTYFAEKKETFGFPTDIPPRIQLTPTRPTARMEIHLFFREKPKPKFVILGYEIYVVWLLFGVANSKKRKMLWVYRKK